MSVTEIPPALRVSTPADFPVVESLLKDARLPLEGVKEQFSSFLVAEEQGVIVGAVGMEYYDSTGLLRSLVVEPGHRSSGLGSALYDAILTTAHQQGVTDIILLTTTAAPFFAKKGFRVVSRESVHGSVTLSREFTGACPSSATVMQRFLGQRVLVVCTGNACRSQIAAAFLRSFDRWLEVFSAGISPAAEIHPLAREVMQELGVSLEGEKPRNVDELLEKKFDYVITVCDAARETCPVFSGEVRRRLHIGFEDPSFALGTRKRRLEKFRAVRDEIRSKMREFYETELLGKGNSPAP